MTLIRCLPIVAMLGMSVASFAQAQPPPRSQWERGGRRPLADRDVSRVQAHVIPAIAGIEAADKAIAVIYELSASDRFDQNDAQASIWLARQALGMALERAAALEDMGGLTRGARVELDRATRSMRRARATLRRMDAVLGERRRRIPLDRAERIRDQARTIHEDLSRAEQSIERIARAYDVPTDLEFRG